MENINKDSGLRQKIANWDVIESELKVLFKNPDLGKENFVLKDKLKYFEDIKNQSKNPVENDKIVRNTLKGTILEIEKQLYPNWWNRQFQRLRRNVESSIEKFIDQRRAVPQSKIVNGESPFYQKTSNTIKASDEGTKQNLKTDITQENKQKDQLSQGQLNDPIKNSLPDRHRVSTGPLRNSNSIGINKDSSKLKDDNVPKHRLRHRLN